MSAPDGDGIALKARNRGGTLIPGFFAARIAPYRFVVSRPALLMRFGVCLKAARQGPSFKTVRPLTGMVREDKEL